MFRPHLICPLLLIGATLYAQSPPTVQARVDGAALVKKIQTELSDTVPLDDARPKVQPGVLLTGTITDSKLYPGTENLFRVYVPSGYDGSKPACLFVELDGIDGRATTALDNLIAQKEIPMMIGVGIVPGAVWRSGTGEPRTALRYNRCYEFDSTNGHFADYVINELLPAVERMKTPDGRAIRISHDGNDHAAMGGSSGGIGAFTLAWQRPDQFSRVFSAIGTFVSMRGGNEYPALIRKTEPKPLRIFLEDGSADAWNPLFGSWYDANLNMESALTFAGYDVAHAWGTHGHTGEAAMHVFPDVMRWLWRDYPARVKSGVSQNSALAEITVPDQGWQKIGQDFQDVTSLAANPAGDVYLSDAGAIYRVGPSDKPAVFLQGTPLLAGLACGPDGTLYGLAAAEKKIIAINSQGTAHTVAEGIAGHAIVATHDGALYISEPGSHTDMPSQIWRVKPDGEKTSLDEGLQAASGIAFSPDNALFYAAENCTQWVYSYIVNSDGSFADKQPFDWLHVTDIPNNSGAEAMAVDTHGNLYVATRMGVQVCDQNGRVRAILTLPTPFRTLRGICFGGSHFDILYVTDGIHVFKRPLKIPGFAPWSAPIAVQSIGIG